VGLIYLDSVLCVYALENRDLRGEQTRRALAKGAARFCVSPLVVMECLVRPLREHDIALEMSYREFFREFDMLDIALDAYQLAARVRATSSLKTPDALHLAAAQQGGCAELWTADRSLAAAAPGFTRDIFAA
jgi:predicted nucleic acid-binding protein